MIGRSTTHRFARITVELTAALGSVEILDAYAFNRQLWHPRTCGAVAASDTCPSQGARVLLKLSGTIRGARLEVHASSRERCLNRGGQAGTASDLVIIFQHQNYRLPRGFPAHARSIWFRRARNL